MRPRKGINSGLKDKQDTINRISNVRVPEGKTIASKGRLTGALELDLNLIPQVQVIVDFFK